MLLYPLILLALIVAGAGGYYAWRVYYSAEQPLTKIPLGNKDRQHDTLLVLLPGISDSERDYLQHGFIDEIQKRQLPVDPMYVDARLHYYMAMTVVERLHTDVVEPALASGYRNIWLAGVSMGGFGALVYANHYPDRVRGVIAMAPYLGKERVIRKMVAGEDTEALASSRYKNTFRLWQWLTGYRQQAQARPELFLAYGERDKFAEMNQLLASQLPEGHTIYTNGQHDWVTWKKLWVSLLEKVDFN